MRRGRRGDLRRLAVTRSFPSPSFDPFAHNLGHGSRVSHCALLGCQQTVERVELTLTAVKGVEKKTRFAALHLAREQSARVKWGQEAARSAPLRLSVQPTLRNALLRSTIFAPRDYCAPQAWKRC